MSASWHTHPVLRRLTAGAIIGSTLLGMIGCASGDRFLERFEYTAIIMAAEARIVLYAPDQASAATAAKAAFDRMNDLEGVMSDYRPNSELMQLCAAPAGLAHPVSDDLFRVLDRAMSMTERTEGAFDITIGPVTHLWRQARAKGAPPDRETIERAMQRCGPHLITLDHAQRTVTLHKNEMQLDPGGIGKGFAVDEAAARLNEHGIKHFLIALAGDIRSGLTPPGEARWRIAIDAGGTERDAQSIPANRAISTSGDLYQFLEHEGTRYSHIIDPHTGRALTQQITVTVVADDATTADALATALSVLGPERAAAVLAEFPGIQAFFSIQQDHGPIERRTIFTCAGRAGNAAHRRVPPADHAREDRSDPRRGVRRSAAQLDGTPPHQDHRPRRRTGTTHRYL